ncbi:hypothetical protein Fot_05875 [Forsythia ovata]|uniref:Uncharacterized protein n=1 Tax=Forsythia ovata TaxID=205694 RepID=A0ABD1WRE1_9LAMI
METLNRQTTRSAKKDVLPVAEDFVSHSRLKLLSDKKCTQERNKGKRMIDTINLTSTSKKKRTNEIYEPWVVGKSGGEHDIPSFDMGDDEVLYTEKAFKQIDEVVKSAIKINEEVYDQAIKIASDVKEKSGTEAQYDRVVICNPNRRHE